MEPYFLNLEGLSMPQTLVVLLLDPKSAETFAMTSAGHPKMPTMHQELVFVSSSAIDRCLVLDSKSSRKNWKK